MKYSDSFIEHMARRLKKPLPGWDVQVLMAPVGRKRPDLYSDLSFSPKKSAVLILLFVQNGEFHTTLIRRPEYNGFHSGQIAFPGGRMEPEDTSAVATALREAREEIGIDDQRVEVLGTLSDIYISPSNYLVTPVIGYYQGVPEFFPDNREVEGLIITPLGILASEATRSVKSIAQSNGIKIKTPYYNIEGFTVWGATAMIISELNMVIAEVISSQNPS